MRVSGSCYCNGVTFVADVDPTSVSTYRVSISASAESFVLEGAVKTFIKVADSGRKRLHAFCPACGSPVYAAAPENATTYTLRIGLIDRRNELAPVQRIWCQSALEWSQNIEALPRREMG